MKSPIQGSRHQSRLLALCLLYMNEFWLSKNPPSIKSVLDQFQDELSIYPKDLQECIHFSTEIVQKARENQASIDKTIENQSKNWKLSRMPLVDRNILRLAIAELEYFENIPPKVTLNEAVELAKKFGNSDSGSFVNGILDPIIQTPEK